MPLLEYLRRLGVAPLPGPPCRRPWWRSFWTVIAAGCWPSEGFGPRSPAVSACGKAFVTAHAIRGLAGLRELASADVTAFLPAESRRLGPKTLQRVATALRSLLRFWHLQGLTGGRWTGRYPRPRTGGRGFPAAGTGQVAALLACATGRLRRGSGIWRC